MAEHMRSWQVSSPGKVEQYMRLNADVPSPLAKNLRAQDILVKIISASLNPADYKVPEMGFIARGVLSFPKTLGMDLGGVVVAVGAGVTDILVGDHVLGRLDPIKAAYGALSEYAILPRQGYSKLSREIDLDWAAAAGTAALTAYQTIQPYVKKGDKVFINGGSGGTGTFGIQIAKLLGCHVTVSCSTAKIQLCRDLGADTIIDYKTTDIAEALKKEGKVYNLAVDNVGNSITQLHKDSATFLLPKGKFVIVGGGSWTQMASIATAVVRPAFLGGGKNQAVPYLTVDSRDDLDQLAKWFNEGHLRAAIDSTYEFEDAEKAIAHLKKGSAGGKIVIHVSPVASR